MSVADRLLSSRPYRTEFIVLIQELVSLYQKGEGDIPRSFGVQDTMHQLPHAKRAKGNPLGEDCFLKRDGTIEKDEDKIIKVQRMWKEEMYKPYGRMMLKVQKDFMSLQK